MSGWDGLIGAAVDGFNSTAPANRRIGAAAPSRTSAPRSSAESSEKKDPWAVLLTPPPTPYSTGDRMRDGINEAAVELGIDPMDLATAISFETGGTFDPVQPGPTTQWGQHRGLIQFGEPQAEENGVDWDDPIGSQLGAGGAVVKYLRRAGVKPGMGMLDVYSAINAGAPGRYNASDANNGGTAGTVMDKVNNQMSGHRRNAMRLLGVEGSSAPSSPTMRTPPAPAEPNRMWLSLGDG